MVVPFIDIRAVEIAQRDVVAAGQRGVYGGVYGPVRVEEVFLRGSYPDTELVLLLREEARPGAVFGWICPVWSELSDDFPGLHGLAFILGTNLTGGSGSLRHRPATRVRARRPDVDVGRPDHPCGGG